MLKPINSRELWKPRLIRPNNFKNILFHRNTNICVVLITSEKRDTYVLSWLPKNKINAVYHPVIESSPMVAN